MKSSPENHNRKECIYAFVMIGIMVSMGCIHDTAFQPTSSTVIKITTGSSQGSRLCSANVESTKPVIKYSSECSSNSAQSTESSQQPSSSPPSPVSRNSSGNQASSKKGRIKSASVEYYNVPLSHDIQNYLFDQCEDRNVPADLVIALMDVESNYNPKLISRTNDYGLMQINICHKDSLRRELQISDLLDERQNIKAGVYMLSGIVNKYNNMNQALMVYNCGEQGAKKLWKNGVYSTDYSRKVLAKLDKIKS